MKTILGSALLIVSFATAHLIAAPALPNILWLTSEDHGPEMGCYGDQLARTPHVDALAAKGMLFKKAWSNAPVCAPARTAIISGVYPSSSGGLHMRSMVSLPPEMRLYPQFLREVGYYCSNNSKEDYNLRAPKDLWNASSNRAHWRDRADGQPFFAIFNSTKSHESQLRTRPHRQVTSPAAVRVPSYHPDTPEVRADWAQYYDQVSAADADAGLRLKELGEAGLAEDTIVFYYGDHGSGMPRSKRWPCNSGLHVPMVVYFPPKWQHLAPKEYTAGGKSERMVSFVDLAPSLLSIAGIQPPPWMQGHAFAGPFQTEPQPFLFGERGRMDERMDQVRSVTDGRYVYLRNYYPHVSQGQRVDFQFQTPTTRLWRALYDAGQATDAQSIFWRIPKTPEELYDLQTDPDEVKNLAQSAEHRQVLEKLRAAQREHLVATRDVCLLPESELHSRAVGSTPYQVARDEQKYPQARIAAAAELASGLDPAALPKLTGMLADTDSAVRYWAALGHLMRGQTAVAASESALTAALRDSAPSVRIVAAQALAQFGGDTSRTAALAVLGELAPPEKNGVLTSMAALAAIEALGPIAAPLLPSIATMSPIGPSPDERYNSYVVRLIQNLSPGKTSTKPAKAAKPSRKTKTGKSGDSP